MKRWGWGYFFFTGVILILSYECYRACFIINRFMLYCGHFNSVVNCRKALWSWQRFNPILFETGGREGVKTQVGRDRGCGEVGATGVPVSHAGSWAPGACRGWQGEGDGEGSGEAPPAAELPAPPGQRQQERRPGGFRHEAFCFYTHQGWTCTRLGGGRRGTAGLDIQKARERARGPVCGP